VLANSCFGSVISEAGQAYSWYENAHEYRLTLGKRSSSDRSGEVFIFVMKRANGMVTHDITCAWPRGLFNPSWFCYSVFAHRDSGIDSELTILVSEHDPVKLALLTLSNNSGRTRKLSVTGYVEWTLGESRSRSAPHIVTHTVIVPAGSGVTANNFYGANGEGRIAFSLSTILIVR
jgi:cellobiose phosphorylase